MFLILDILRNNMIQILRLSVCSKFLKCDKCKSKREGRAEYQLVYNNQEELLCYKHLIETLEKIL